MVYSLAFISSSPKNTQVLFNGKKKNTHTHTPFSRKKNGTIWYTALNVMVLSGVIEEHPGTGHSRNVEIQIKKRNRLSFST